MDLQHNFVKFCEARKDIDLYTALEHRNKELSSAFRNMVNLIFYTRFKSSWLELYRTGNQVRWLTN